jgi:hypothetical protein
MKIGDLVHTYHYIINDPYHYYDINNNDLIYGIVLDIGREWEDDYLNLSTQSFKVFWSNKKITWNRIEDFLQLSSF